MFPRRAAVLRHWRACRCRVSVIRSRRRPILLLSCRPIVRLRLASLSRSFVTIGRELRLAVRTAARSAIVLRSLMLTTFVPSPIGLMAAVTVTGVEVMVRTVTLRYGSGLRSERVFRSRPFTARAYRCSIPRSTVTITAFTSASAATASPASASSAAAAAASIRAITRAISVWPGSALHAAVADVVANKAIVGPSAEVTSRALLGGATLVYRSALLGASALLETTALIGATALLTAGAFGATAWLETGSLIVAPGLVATSAWVRTTTTLFKATTLVGTSILITANTSFRASPLILTPLATWPATVAPALRRTLARAASITASLAATFHSAPFASLPAFATVVVTVSVFATTTVILIDPLSAGARVGLTAMARVVASAVTPALTLVARTAGRSGRSGARRHNGCWLCLDRRGSRYCTLADQQAFEPADHTTRWR